MIGAHARRARAGERMSRRDGTRFADKGMRQQ